MTDAPVPAPDTTPAEDRRHPECRLCRHLNAAGPEPRCTLHDTALPPAAGADGAPEPLLLCRSFDPDADAVAALDPPEAERVRRETERLAAIAGELLDHMLYRADPWSGVDELTAVTRTDVRRS